VKTFHLFAPLEEYLTHLEEDATRLPRPLAYLLILVISIAFWAPIGIWIFTLAEQLK